MIELAHLSSWLKALGDTGRLRIVHLLCYEELTVGELVKIVELPQSTVSRHLKPLKEQGLVADRPSGSATYYRAALEAEIGNGETALRDFLAATLRATPLPPADARRLAQVLSMRESGGDDFFDRIGQRWDALREACFGPSFHLEALLHLLPAEWTVADLGTGTGYLLPPLARHFKKVIGVDMSEPMLDLAQLKLETEGVRNVDLRPGKLETLPLKKGEANLALAILMLHHMEDVPAALREIHRVLKPGGRLLIVELGEHKNEKFRVAMSDRRLGIAPAQMRAWLEESGFSELEKWDYPNQPFPGHELAPIPALFGMIAQKN